MGKPDKYRQDKNESMRSAGGGAAVSGQGVKGVQYAEIIGSDFHRSDEGVCRGRI